MKKSLMACVMGWAAFALILTACQQRDYSEYPILQPQIDISGYPQYGCINGKLPVTLPAGEFGVLWYRDAEGACTQWKFIEG